MSNVEILPRARNPSEPPWRGEIRTWVQAKRSLADCDPGAAADFFERAVSSVHSPDNAWFGIHKDRVSVVIGGLFLAALHAGKENRGVWLLLDSDHTLPSVGSLEYHPTDPRHRAPNLIWGHARDVARIHEINESGAIWQAISRASRAIPSTPMGSARDDVQLRHKKVRVSQLRDATPALVGEADGVSTIQRPLGVTPASGMGALEQSDPEEVRDTTHNRLLSDPTTRHATIARMAAAARKTVSAADGRKVSRTLKIKDLRFADDGDFERHIEELVDRQSGRCAISGLPLQVDDPSSDPELRCSLDRIDSNGHYEFGNLQIVCQFINRWKNDSDNAQFRRLIALVIQSGKIELAKPKDST